MFSIVFACAAFLIFSFSSLHINKEKAIKADNYKNILIADFQRIVTKIGTGRTIFIDGNHQTIGGAYHAVNFYLAGNYFQPSAENVEFILSRGRNKDLPLLTPQNKKVFLYLVTKPKAQAEHTK